MSIIQFPAGGKSVLNGGVDGEALQWFVRMHDASVPEADSAAFAAWRADPSHTQAYAELERIWDGLDNIKIVGAGVKTAAWRGGLRRAGGVAASVLAVMVIGGGWLSAPTGAFVFGADHRTDVGARERVTLSDGTTVTLDAASAIATRITPTSRRVDLLAGQAFFQVAHDPSRPFSVGAGAATIHDIGTAFNVERTKTGGTVTVADGQVSIVVGQGRPVVLGRGASVDYGRSLDAATACDPDDVAAWRSGRLVFVDAALSNVLADIQRYRGGRFVVLNRTLASRRVTGVFNVHRPNEALDSILRFTRAKVATVGPLTFMWS